MLLQIDVLVKPFIEYSLLVAFLVISIWALAKYFKTTSEKNQDRQDALVEKLFTLIENNTSALTSMKESNKETKEAMLETKEAMNAIKEEMTKIASDVDDLKRK